MSFSRHDNFALTSHFKLVLKSYIAIILFFLGTAKADTLDFLAPPFQRQDTTELIRLVSELERLEPLNNSQKTDSMVSRYFLSVAYGKAGKIHAKQNELSQILDICEVTKENKYVDFDPKLKARFISVCLLATSEMLNYVSSFRGWGLANAKDAYFSELELSRLDPANALYVEALIYSNLPPYYGQKLGKALLNLEILKRMHPEYSVPSELIESIRILQGKTPGPRIIKDGNNFGVFPTIFGMIPQGFGMQIRFQDDKIFETERSLRGRVFGSLKGSFGGEFRFDDDASIAESQFTLKGSFLYGIQEFHGFGIGSPRDSIDLYFNRGTGELSFRKNFCEFCALRVGWQFNSAHFRYSDSVPAVSGQIGFTNSFDSGAFGEIGLDSTDSRFDPYEGRALYLRGYFPVKNFLSLYSYEKYELSYDEFIKLGMKYTLRASLMVDSASSNIPFWFIPQLAGRIPLPAVRLTRFQEKNVLGSWLEFRGRNWEPLTWIVFLTTGTVAPKFSELFKESYLFGFGAGGEFKLSRFRHRMLRVEMGNFAGEFGVRAQFWVPID